MQIAAHLVQARFRVAQAGFRLADVGDVAAAGIGAGTHLVQALAVDLHIVFRDFHAGPVAQHFQIGLYRIQADKLRGFIDPMGRGFDARDLLFDFAIGEETVEQELAERRRAFLAHERDVVLAASLDGHVVGIFRTRGGAEIDLRQIECPALTQFLIDGAPVVGDRTHLRVRVDRDLDRFLEGHRLRRAGPQRQGQQAGRRD